MRTRFPGCFGGSIVIYECMSAFIDIFSLAPSSFLNEFSWSVLVCFDPLGQNHCWGTVIVIGDIRLRKHIREPEDLVTSVRSSIHHEIQIIIRIGGGGEVNLNTVLNWQFSSSNEMN